MILSTQTDNIFRRFGEDEGIKIFARAGYDAIDLSMFQMTHDDCPLNTIDPDKYGSELKKKAESAGIVFNQAHAPFPCWRSDDKDYSAKMPERVKQSIRIAGAAGAKQIIVHPIAYPGGGEPQKQFNFEFYRSLEQTALDWGIKIALENMWGHDQKRDYIIPNVCSLGADLAEYYDGLGNPDAFTVCLDLGHCGLVGEEAQDAIRALGHDRLGALHVHDNDYRHDTHTIPYDAHMKMNWDEITKALGEIDYKGEFTFEADNFLGHFSDDVVFDAVCFMVVIGRKLCSKVDAARPKNA